MTVKELIDKLSTFDENEVVYLRVDEFYGRVDTVMDVTHRDKMSLTRDKLVSGIFLDSY